MLVNCHWSGGLPLVGFIYLRTQQVHASMSLSSTAVMKNNCLLLLHAACSCCCAAYLLTAVAAYTVLHRVSVNELKTIYCLALPCMPARTALCYAWKARKPWRGNFGLCSCCQLACTSIMHLHHAFGNVISNPTIKRVGAVDAVQLS